MNGRIETTTRVVIEWDVHELTQVVDALGGRGIPDIYFHLENLLREAKRAEQR